MDVLTRSVLIRTRTDPIRIQNDREVHPGCFTYTYYQYQRISLLCRCYTVGDICTPGKVYARMCTNRI